MTEKKLIYVCNTSYCGWEGVDFEEQIMYDYKKVKICPSCNGFLNIKYTKCCNSELRENDFYEKCEFCKKLICYNCIDSHMKIHNIRKKKPKINEKIERKIMIIKDFFNVISSEQYEVIDKQKSDELINKVVNLTYELNKLYVLK